jgi:hypothetical protein
MADVLIQIRAEVAKANAQLQSLDDRMKGVAKTASTGMGFTEFSSALLIAERGLRTAKQAFDATAGAALNYTFEVKDLSSALRLSYEETSRIIQVADDFRVNMGEVQVALAMATKNGFLPTIDNLAKMADGFNAETNANKRAAEMAKIFGRNWTALVPLLEKGGDAIREHAQAVEQGLIVTEEGVQAAEDYQRATDELSDAWTALRINIGNEVIPVVADLVENFNLGEQAISNLRERGIVPTQLAISREIAAMKALAVAAQNVAEAGKNVEGEWHGALSGIAEDSGAAAAAVDSLTVSTQNLSAANIGSQAMKDLDQALSDGTITQEQYDLAARDVMGSLLGMDSQAVGAAFKIRGLSADFGAGAVEAYAYIDALQALAAALGEIPGEGVDFSRGESERPGGVFAQHGTDFVVPPGFPNDTFPIRASSGERVVVIPQSTQTDSRSFTFNTTVNDGAGGMGLLERMKQDVRRL